MYGWLLLHEEVWGKKLHAFQSLMSAWFGDHYVNAKEIKKVALYHPELRRLDLSMVIANVCIEFHLMVDAPMSPSDWLNV